jgi:hypothetical protein
MTETTAEEWRMIPGYEGRYEVSDHGRIRSIPRRKVHGGILAAATDGAGYPSVLLYDDQGPSVRLVHRLVALTFIGPCPEGQQVRHRNGNPMDPTASNLTYGTHGQNQLDSIAHGTHVQARKTHCPQGHPYDEANTYRSPSAKSYRQCRTCVRAGARARYQRAKAAQVGVRP